MKNEFYTNVHTMGNNVLYRGYKNRKRIHKKIPYLPKLYVSSNEESEYQTLSGASVSEIAPGTIKETRDFISTYADVEGFEVYGDFPAHYKLINERFGSRDVDYNLDDIRVGYLDIEYDTEDGFADPSDPFEPITAISIKIKGRFHVLGIKPYTPKNGQTVYYQCADEPDLLHRFIKLWRDLDLDIVSGWNIQFFDIPYLVNRISRILSVKDAKMLSPWGAFSFRNAIVHGKDNQAITLIGISVLDYMELYKKFTYTQKESYKLDHIAFEELDEKKLSYDEYKSLHHLYQSNFEKYIDYNIKDVDLVERLEDKMRFIEMAITLAYSSKVNFNDVFSQVRMWDTMIHNYLLDRKIVIPQKTTTTKSEQYAGAYVKDPICGMHDWIVSFDLASLYPHLIMQFNISPETLSSISFDVSVDDLLERKLDNKTIIEKNLSLAANGHTFKRDNRGFLPEMMNLLYVQRSEYKKEMIKAQKRLEIIEDKINQGGSTKELKEEKRQCKSDIVKFNNFQLARKVQLNSAYGALGNKYFRHYDLRQAEAITKSGQLVIRWISNKMDEYFNKVMGTNESYVIAGDTDSIYLRLGPLIESVMPNADKNKIVNFIDKICEEKIQPYINKCYAELAEYLNAYEQKMVMEREVIADRGVWVAKKRYILNVHDTEGVRHGKPKVKIMGLEAVKSSTPSSCRQKLKDAMRVILNGSEDDIIDFISDFRSTFESLPIAEIAFPRGVNGIEKYADDRELYIKGTPIHVKGALIYNSLIKSNKLEREYELIRNADKIKFIYLKEPNTIQSPVIAMHDNLPEEFGLDKFIDHEKQFEKAFLDPLKTILDKIGWKVERISSLEDFFG